MQFTNLEERGEHFRNTQYLFKLLNYTVPSMVFLNVTLIFVGDWRGESLN